MFLSVCREQRDRIWDSLSPLVTSRKPSKAMTQATEEKPGRTQGDTLNGPTHLILVSSKLLQLIPQNRVSCSIPGSMEIFLAAALFKEAVLSFTLQKRRNRRQQERPPCPSVSVPFPFLLAETFPHLPGLWETTINLM
jgi:hypothetical protein